MESTVRNETSTANFLDVHQVFLSYPVIPPVVQVANAPQRISHGYSKHVRDLRHLHIKINKDGPAGNKNVSSFFCGMVFAYSVSGGHQLASAVSWFHYNFESLFASSNQ